MTKESEACEVSNKEEDDGNKESNKSNDDELNKMQLP